MSETLEADVAVVRSTALENYGVPSANEQTSREV